MMPSTRRPLRLLCAIPLLLCTVTVSATHAAVLAGLDTVSRNIYRIDSDNLGGPPTLIGQVNAGTDLYELTPSAYGAGGGAWYTFDRDANTLITISPADAHVLCVVPLDQDAFVTRRGFDLSPGGTLYGVLPGMQLRTINPATGATTFLANITGAARVEAIAFALDGRLFAAGSLNDDEISENLYRLDPVSGALTLLGPTGAPDIDTLAFGDGQLFGADSVDNVPGHLYQLNLTTGAATDLGNTNVPGLNGLLVIPEPTAGLLLCAVALIRLLPRSPMGLRPVRSRTCGVVRPPLTP